MYLIFVLWDKNPYSLFSKCNDSEERRGGSNGCGTGRGK